MRPIDSAPMSTNSWDPSGPSNIIKPLEGGTRLVYVNTYNGIEYYAIMRSDSCQPADKHGNPMHGPYPLAFFYDLFDVIRIEQDDDQCPFGSMLEVLGESIRDYS